MLGRGRWQCKSAIAQQRQEQRRRHVTHHGTRSAFLSIFVAFFVVGVRAAGSSLGSRPAQIDDGGKSASEAKRAGVADNGRCLAIQDPR
jgi:hypothetical protein